MVVYDIAIPTLPYITEVYRSTGLAKETCGAKHSNILKLSCQSSRSQNLQTKDNKGKYVNVKKSGIPWGEKF